MNELSLYLLDIMQNSIKASAKNVLLEIIEDIDNNLLTIKIEDDGKGIEKDKLEKVLSPFYTTRTTRKVGLGLPLFKELANMCEGDLSITSEVEKGTNLVATFKLDHIDLPPFGSWVETFYLLIINEENVDIAYKHKLIKENNENEFIFDTKEVKKILDGVSLKEGSIATFLKSYIKDGLNNIGINNI